MKSSKNLLLFKSFPSKPLLITLLSGTMKPQQYLKVKFRSSIGFLQLGHLAVNPFSPDVKRTALEVVPHEGQITDKALISNFPASNSFLKSSDKRLSLIGGKTFLTRPLSPSIFLIVENDRFINPPVSG